MSERVMREKLMFVAKEFYRNQAIQQQNFPSSDFYLKATQNMTELGNLLAAMGASVTKVDVGSVMERFVVKDGSGIVIPNNDRLA
jgi:hypothetical protein